MALLVNTRQHRRFATKLMVKITSGSLSFWATTSNVSQKGLCIRANQEFPVNKALSLELIMPDGHISTIRGTVRHVNESPQLQRRFGIGIEIIEDDTTYRNYLQDLEKRTVLYSTKEAVYVQDVAKDAPAGSPSEAPVISNPPDELPSLQKEQEELCEQVPAQTPEEELREPAYVTTRKDNPSRARDRDKKRKVLPVFLILLLAIGIVTGGVFLYGSLIQNQAIQPAKDLICSIQVGAFKSKANAQGLLQKYQDRGHRVFIGTSDIKGKGIMHKVLIGPFQNISETSQVAEDIRLKEQINPFVMCE